MLTADGAASVPRCLAVWSAVTVLSIGAAGVGLDALLGAIAAAQTNALSFDQVLVALAGSAAVVICPWLWLVSSLTIGEALSGRVRRGDGWIRRLTLTACGCAVGLAWIAPAHADGPPPSSEPHSPTTSVSVLSGLPYPERPSTRPPGDHDITPREGVRATAPQGPQAPQASPTAPVPVPQEPGTLHVVAHGDTLWAIAADSLRTSQAAASPTSAQTAHAVRVLHERNRGVLGTDPDLIHPGQRLDTTLGGGQEK